MTKRAILSCDLCRSRKVRCNKSEPCEGCVLRGVPCERLDADAQEVILRQQAEARRSQAEEAHQLRNLSPQALPPIVTAHSSSSASLASTNTTASVSSNSSHSSTRSSNTSNLILPSLSPIPPLSLTAPSPQSSATTSSDPPTPNLLQVRLQSLQSVNKALGSALGLTSAQLALLLAVEEARVLGPGHSASQSDLSSYFPAQFLNPQATANALHASLAAHAAAATAAAPPVLPKQPTLAPSSSYMMTSHNPPAHRMFDGHTERSHRRASPPIMSDFMPFKMDPTLPTPAPEPLLSPMTDERMWSDRDLSYVF